MFCLPLLTLATLVAPPLFLAPTNITGPMMTDNADFVMLIFTLQFIRLNLRDWGGDHEIRIRNEPIYPRLPGQVRGGGVLRGCGGGGWGDSHRREHLLDDWRPE